MIIKTTQSGWPGLMLENILQLYFNDAYNRLEQTFKHKGIFKLKMTAIVIIKPQKKQSAMFYKVPWLPRYLQKQIKFNTTQSGLPGPVL